MVVNVNGVNKKYDSINDLKLDDIIDYVLAQNDTEWLKKVANTQKKDKQGNKRKITFIELRKEFVLHYNDFADFRPKYNSAKKPSFIDRINNL